MECNNVRDLLIDYAKGALDQDTYQKVEQHLMECGACAKEAHATRRLLAATQAASEEPTVELANEIIQQGIASRASDIHLQAEPQHVLLRYRIDGVLYEDRRVDRSQWDALFTRFAIMADIHVTERQAPQDGRIRICIGGKDYDLRLSYIPTTTGGKIVMRILDTAALQLDLEKMGLSKENADTLKILARSPNGLIAVTGPVGCGKTTLLYALLNDLNSTSLNLVSIEDPVEYLFDRVAQIHVNPRKGVTFPTALRAVMRQDPDVIMVGEIRDLETAELIIRAAITGHLVMTALHAPDAPGAVRRLLDVGVEPFLLESTLIGVVAMRLVRKICTHCKEEVSLPAELTDRLTSLAPEFGGKTLSKGRGCEQCRQTGYRGRIGIFEILSVNQEMARLIGGSPQLSELQSAAAASGMTTLLQDGLRKAAAGITTVEEVLRVAPGVG